ncbi:MAG TPA: thiamine diphosphokinase [Bacillota bacterium]|nr:thiamine diphosphokinase [Bacillota bacterium]
MKVIGIVGNGPVNMCPNLHKYTDEVDLWIGADAGAYQLIRKNIDVSYAVGDFDSLSQTERDTIEARAEHVISYKEEKDMTDMELAIEKALEYEPHKVLIFGATGGRLDHEIVNIQLLLKFADHHIEARIIDKQNIVQLVHPGTYTVEKEEGFPYLSFIAFTPTVSDLTLQNFRYDLNNVTIQMGSSLCISNEIVENNGTFSFKQGTLLVIKSTDV